MSKDTFGQMPSGEAVIAVSLQTAELRARIISYGAALADLEFHHPKGWRRLVLGLNTLEDYQKYSPHFGATAGRYAGKIRDGRVTIDGTAHQLSRNAADGHHVHGGASGLGKRNWSLVESDTTSATFEIVSRDGDEGYPGTLTARCTYRLRRGTLEVEMTATTTRATPVNLLHHSYFNLDGRGTTDSHQIRIDADLRAVVGSDGLPTGDFAPLNDDRTFDFQDLRKPTPGVAYDFSYLLRSRASTSPRPVALLVSSSGDLGMEVETTEPALHFYDGSKLAVPAPGLSGDLYRPRAGLCLEPTRMSDAPNLDGFPDTILRPGETYRQITAFSFHARESAAQEG